MANKFGLDSIIIGSCWNSKAEASMVIYCKYCNQTLKGSLDEITLPELINLYMKHGDECHLSVEIMIDNPPVDGV